MDGITYEMWKTLHRRHRDSKEAGNECLDVLKLMTACFNDIETHGMIRSSRFAEGWMCPIYKKNDRNEVAVRATAV